MASVIRVGQSKFVTVPIDEDSTERIMNCIQTLSELESARPVHQIFLHDTKAAYSKMVAAQEVRYLRFKSIDVPILTPWLAEEGRGEEGIGAGQGRNCPGRRLAHLPPVLEEGRR